MDGDMRPRFCQLRRRASLADAVRIAFLIAILMQAVSASAAPSRIASLNMCTDQLLLMLADPEQIAGLSPYARDRDRSFMASAADRFPVLSGGAEDVLILAPDLVVAGRFMRRATHEFLRARGASLVEFDVARSISEAKEQILHMGILVGHPDRAAAEVARIDAAIERTRAAALRTPTPRRVLAVSRRGWVSGGETLTTSLLAAAGLANAAPDLGFGSGGFATLESIVAIRPDFILVTDAGERPEDQGQAFLLHPALQRLYPLERRIIIPERLTACAGPMLADALDRLADAIDHLNR
jgi:iron complex transport system substrate-binding protein